MNIETVTLLQALQRIKSEGDALSGEECQDIAQQSLQAYEALLPQADVRLDSYFAAQLGCAPEYTSRLEKCALPSVAGQLCKSVIDAAAILVRALRESAGAGSAKEMLLISIASQRINVIWDEMGPL